MSAITGSELFARNLIVTGAVARDARVKAASLRAKRSEAIADLRGAWGVAAAMVAIFAGLAGTVAFFAQRGGI